MFELGVGLPDLRQRVDVRNRQCEVAVGDQAAFTASSPSWFWGSLFLSAMGSSGGTSAIPAPLVRGRLESDGRKSGLTVLLP